MAWSIHGPAQWCSLAAAPAVLVRKGKPGSQAKPSLLIPNPILHTVAMVLSALTLSGKAAVISLGGVRMRQPTMLVQLLFRRVNTVWWTKPQIKAMLQGHPAGSRVTRAALAAQLPPEWGKHRPKRWCFPLPCQKHHISFVCLDQLQVQDTALAEAVRTAGGDGRACLYSCTELLLQLFQWWSTLQGSHPSGAQQLSAQPGPEAPNHLTAGDTGEGCLALGLEGTRRGMDMQQSFTGVLMYKNHVWSQVSSITND